MPVDKITSKKPLTDDGKKLAKLLTLQMLRKEILKRYIQNKKKANADNKTE